ncbi:MAG TPA: Rrf2 family transcriptional regulator [Chitinophagaceae bacterium]|nr:Rrf2 family transcriptional regulator [Chitinophagaceae bacterium]
MFSKTTEYALRAVMHIAANSSEEKKLSLGEIAEAIDSPRSFTAKILQLLTGEGGLISSTRGPSGGFFITDKQLQKPVRSILQAMDEDRKLVKCVIGLSECSEVRPCPLHAKYKSIKAQLISMFEDKTIGQLVIEMEKSSTVVNNRKRKK